MKSLLWILRAGHCRGTHHRFAIDALPMVQTDSGKRLVRLLACHHRRYLAGACDPDVRFRDYQNHVIHVADGYWGGAPRVAHQWYDALQRALRRRRLGDAAHAAGVLSHYFTDPIQPLHTHQCERAEVAHRPIEWSVHCAYDDILWRWREDACRVVFQLGDGPGWLGESILHAARLAHRRYPVLLDDFRLDRVRSDPAGALAGRCRQVLSELFGLAITGWARVLERAAADVEAAMGQPLPNVSLSMPTAAAAVSAPVGSLARWFGHRGEREAVAALVGEFERTGTLAEQLPSEVDVIRRVIRVRRDELQWQQQWRHESDSRPTEPTMRIVGSDVAEPPPQADRAPSRRAA